MAAVHSIINNGNKLYSENALTPSDANAALDALRKMDTVLNVLFKPAEALPEQLQTLLTQRAAARTAKQWAESDRIRAEIVALGWTVKDTPEGQKALKL